MGVCVLTDFLQAQQISADIHANKSARKKSGVSFWVEVDSTKGAAFKNWWFVCD